MHTRLFAIIMEYNIAEIYIYTSRSANSINNKENRETFETKKEKLMHIDEEVLRFGEMSGKIFCIGISVCIPREFLALIFGASNFSDEDVIAIGRKVVDKITRARKMPEGRLLYARKRAATGGCRGIGYRGL